MQGYDKGDMWIARKCVAQGQRPMCRQFRDEAVRERFDAVVFVLLVLRCYYVRGDTPPCKRLTLLILPVETGLQTR